MNDIVGRRLERIRINKVLPYIKGNLLDIGCGNNKLTKIYGSGIGVDVYDWGNVDMIVEDSARIALENNSFDTITVLAALNHIPNREKVIVECHRLLQEDGNVIITMIPPLISTIWHSIRKPWDIDQTERGMKEGEVYGMRKKEIIDLFHTNHFKLVIRSSFMCGINQLFIFQKINKTSDRSFMKSGNKLI